MAKVIITDTYLKAIGDAIRNKEGSSGTIPLTDMPSRIESLASGGVNRDQIFCDDGNYYLVNYEIQHDGYPRFVSICMSYFDYAGGDFTESEALMDLELSVYFADMQGNPIQNYLMSGYFISEEYLICVALEDFGSGDHWLYFKYNKGNETISDVLFSVYDPWFLEFKLYSSSRIDNSGSGTSSVGVEITYV